MTPKLSAFENMVEVVPTDSKSSVKVLQLAVQLANIYYNDSMSLPVITVIEITLHGFVSRLDISQFCLLQLQLKFKNKKLMYANKTKGFFF